VPPQANATVTAVGQARAEAAGAVDDWDVQTAAPAVGSPGAVALVKWSGTIRGYYRESTTRETVNGSTNVLAKRELILDTDDVLAIALDTDDVITFTVDGRAGERTARASVIPTPALAGIPRALQTARVRLEDA
jgi:hypothetical protein